MKLSIALRQAFAIIIAIGLLAGCAETSAVPEQTPTQTGATPLPLANVTCNELSFYLDPELGSGVDCTTVAENATTDIPMDIFIYPTHTELLINNYRYSKTQFPPQIIVYPVTRFSELLPDVVPQRVADLLAYKSSGTWNGGEVPFLPPLPMLQSFYSHDTRILFINGEGVRFITDYNESNHPLSNRTIFYTFQGLTNDGKYWVSVKLPVSNPVLPDDADIIDLPEGYSNETWFQEYDSYIELITSTLQPQSPASFSPNLEILDHLVNSIIVSP